MRACVRACVRVCVCKGGVDGTAGTANAVPLSESLRRRRTRATF